ncbi:hypothetical protein GAYE_SCF28MG4775 [Galdieria yellowstonensis]|uniref:Oxidoreductase-like domain-containing protein n=1 Tax=Galdieria yellowstonensis TaxID=3028027 RepID=A0AAV9IHA7_9RHOD|nr:hypothetical protein GAYE_SCF28MG4775 [Galdieria yellowstonensis]
MAMWWWRRTSRRKIGWIATAIPRYWKTYGKWRVENTICCCSKRDEHEEDILGIGNSTRMTRPQPPPPESCCGNGCPDCVWTVYLRQLEEYEEEQKKRKKARDDR